MTPPVAEKQQSSPASYADFSDAREGGWLRTLVQFFAIPFLIVCVAVGLYVGISLMVGSGADTAADFVVLLQSDTINRRTQAAYELAQRLAGKEIPEEFRDKKLVAALCGALEKARDENQNPPHQARVILSILGRLADPASTEAVRRALDDKHPWVRSYAILALAKLDDDQSVGRLREYADHDDAGTRQAALYALAQLDQVEGLPRFRISVETREIALRHLGDAKEDVRFTAALILADAGEKDVPRRVLYTMLDRKYLERFPLDSNQSGFSQYQIHSNVIRKAIAAVVKLKLRDDANVNELLEKLTDDDNEGDPEVRQQAREALRMLKGK